MKHFIYIIQAEDGLYYTGSTKNLEERMCRHNTGRGSKFTKAKRPVRLVYYEETADLKTAMQREKQIKDFSRLKKENLICEFQKLPDKKI